MNTFERLRIRPSDRHRVSVKPDSIQIFAVDGSWEAIERFQLVALEAIENEGNGYEIYGTPLYRTSRFLGRPYDTIVLLKKEGD